MTESPQQAGALWEQELSKRAEQLRKICDTNGKEKDTKKSAFIFHQMGLLYKGASKEDDSTAKMLSLIRSAALLNAAISRQPGNKQFKKDLEEFCTDLLKIAGSKKLKANLLKIAKNVLEMAKEMRNEISRSLQKLKIIPFDVTKDKKSQMEIQKIKSIKAIQTQITQKYKKIMQHIASECEKIMGHPPCKYSITGMGSLARCEITPYSDFEHIILLEEGVQMKDNYDDILEHFRWFSVIFHVIVINLGETTIQNVAIPSFKHVTKAGEKEFFDAFTKSGISFDSLKPYACHFPLGRIEKTKTKTWTTELIKPISEMLKYFNKDEDLKNGYHLPNVLMNICFVCGDEQIYQQFSDAVKDVLQSSVPFHHERVLQQIKEDLDNFEAFKGLNALNANSKCNIKKLVYRSTALFVSALGQLNSVGENSSFGIIDQLNSNNIIDDKTAHLLSYAIAVSCEVRLKVYVEKESQGDYVGQEQLYNEWDNKVFGKLVDTAGERSMVDYFAIAFKLQNIFFEEEDLCNLKFNITLKPVDYFRMLYMLDLHNRVLGKWNSHLQDQLENTSFDDELWIEFFVADACYETDQYNDALLMLERLEGQNIQDPLLKGAVMRDKAWCLYQLDRSQEALQFIGRVWSDFLYLVVPDRHIYDFLGDLSFISAECQYELEKYHVAIDQYMDASVYTGGVDQCVFPGKESRRADCFCNIGWCLCALGDYDAAITEAKKSLKHYEKHNAPVSDKCDCFHLLGVCHLRKSDYAESLSYFQTEVGIRLQFVPKESQDSDEDIKIARSIIQTCREKLDR
ncbi:unnamed protein product [Clavelina lepadiformis]|uniref:Protein-PII uridylyltransferase N-terminal domain-containing protein n=1 Tax=Clavelina lepadiformis TaxID=159417 RepID=A0ABP0GAD5_CLALP